MVDLALFHRTDSPSRSEQPDQLSTSDIAGYACLEMPIAVCGPSDAVLNSL